MHKVCLLFFLFEGRDFFKKNQTTTNQAFLSLLCVTYIKCFCNASVRNRLYSRQQKGDGPWIQPSEPGNDTCCLWWKAFKRKTIPLVNGMVNVGLHAYKPEVLHHIHCRPLERISKYEYIERNEKLQKFRVVMMFWSFELSSFLIRLYIGPYWCMSLFLLYG